MVVFFSVLGISLAMATIGLVKLGFILLGGQKNSEFLSISVALIFGAISIWVKAPALKGKVQVISDISQQPLAPIPIP